MVKLLKAYLLKTLKSNLILSLLWLLESRLIRILVTFFAHSLHIKLALPQAALLSQHFSLEILEETVVLHLHEGPDEGRTAA